MALIRNITQISIAKSSFTVHWQVVKQVLPILQNVQLFYASLANARGYNASLDDVDPLCGYFDCDSGHPYIRNQIGFGFGFGSAQPTSATLPAP